MAINLTDSLNAATTKGKLGDAKQVYLNGDTKDLQQAYEETNAHFGTLDNRSTQMEKAIQDISATGGASTANAVSYNNSTSKLKAITAQGAIDEVSSIGHLAKRGGIVNISTNYNSINTAEVLTLAQAIAKVPSEDRVLGFQGKFLSENGWKVYTFTGESVANWLDKSKWDLVLNSSEVLQELGDSTALPVSQKLISYNIASGSDTSEIESKEVAIDASSGKSVDLPFLVKKGLQYTVSIESSGNTVGQVYAKPYAEGGKSYGDIINSGSLSFVAKDDYDKIIVYFPTNKNNGTVKVKARIGNKERFEKIENSLYTSGLEDVANNVLLYTEIIRGDNGSSQKELSSSFLKKNNIVTLGIDGNETNITAFGFRSDGTYLHIGTFSDNKRRITINLPEDYEKIRFYNNSTGTFSCFIALSSRFDENDFSVNNLLAYFQNSNSGKKDITWKNIGKYWTNTGVLVANSSYDISEPINVTGFKYYGYFGNLNKGNTCIVSVDSEGNFNGKIIQEGVLDYTINGNSLFLFRIPDDIDYISLSNSNASKSSVELFELRSPFLIRILDNESNIEGLRDEFKDSLTEITSTTSERQIEFHNRINRNGVFSIILDKSDLSNEKGVTVFGFRDSSNYDFLGLFRMSEEKLFVAKNDYEFIRLYDNNPEYSGYSATLKLYSFSANINKKLESVKSEINKSDSNISEIFSYFKSSSQITKDLIWKEAGGFWNNQGIFTEQSSYDISEPINVSDFKYYGLFGMLHEGNYSVVAVNESGKFTNQVIQTGILDWQNTGYSLYIFKVPDDVNYISVSASNNNKARTELFQLKSPFLIDLINKSSSSYAYLFGKDSMIRSSTDTKSRTVTVPYAIKKDKWYEVKLSGCSSSSYKLNVYTTVYPAPAYGDISINSPILRFKAIADETAVRCWVNINGDENPINVTITVKELGYDEVKNLENNNSSESVEYSVLILGNSYSQGGAWVKGMKEWLNITNLVNLGVSSATVRDRYSDRNTHPYTDRPVSSDNSGNHNTLSCQIQKLKRLMAGTDLDEGESQIYTSESEYPNVIIIEGGMNDSYDTDEKEQTYFAQFEKKVDGVYIQQLSSKEVTQGSCYIKTPIEEVDRTCYAGAYRYLVEELLNLFPKAQIFFTTASGLGYWNDSVVERRYRTAEQQRKCANLCAANIIDWSAEGQISAILTHPQGSGTEDDPYVWAQCTLPNADSTDLMHPNARGGKKYGHLAALTIKQRFLDIYNM